MHVEILVKQIRMGQNMTLGKLADKSGISRTHINDIENNLKTPSLFVMIKLARALDVEITELYKVIW